VADKVPMNAELLTMLLPAVCSFFRLSLEWLLTNSQRQGALCSWGVVDSSLTIACEDVPFLGVLRLQGFSAPLTRSTGAILAR
jgi:hypothetical protein